jgi:hypothetical protein
MTVTPSPLASPFELLELPDGRCYVARAAATDTTLVAGSFARLDPPQDEPASDAPFPDPVGVYPSRDEAEVAILRASPSIKPAGPLSSFAPWLRQD